MLPEPDIVLECTAPTTKPCAPIWTLKKCANVFFCAVWKEYKLDEGKPLG